ncbi:hypothetical protein [Streptomyces sp. NPDC101178]|uniref:hypothetical protein n=1 Tax=Streptomyces sp. NPDC101178 TaxID=3366124 RepID=UPI0038158DB6
MLAAAFVAALGFGVAGGAAGSSAAPQADEISWFAGASVNGGEISWSVQAAAADEISWRTPKASAPGEISWSAPADTVA